MRIDDKSFQPLRVAYLREESLRMSPKALVAADHALWFYLIQLSEDDVSGIGERVAHHVCARPELAEARDVHGRSALSVATPSNQRAINSVLLIHGRYRLRSLVPAHQSATCFVFEAVDEGCVDGLGHPLPAVPVAMKFMYVKAQFLREVYSRLVSFDPALIMDIVRTHHDTSAIRATDQTNPSLDACPDRVEAGAGTRLKKCSAEKMFCIVLPMAERNLFVALKQERFAGRDLEEVRHVMRRLVSCVHNMHVKNYLHADLKPLNIMRREGGWTLIDLDAV